MTFSAYTINIFTWTIEVFGDISLNLTLEGIWRRALPFPYMSEAGKLNMTMLASMTYTY